MALARVGSQFAITPQTDPGHGRAAREDVRTMGLPALSQDIAQIGSPIGSASEFIANIRPHPEQPLNRPQTDTEGQSSEEREVDHVVEGVPPTPEPGPTA